MVWATKRRRRALTQEEEREYCERLLRRVGEKYEMDVLALEVDVDHVHLYAEISPQLSVGQAVRLFKSLSARHMLRKLPYLRRRFYSDAMWSPSYFVRSVGDGVTAETVRQYIERHDAREELHSVQTELFAPAAAKKRRQRETEK
ncbi:MAG: IS200/IS605 family transposase [Deltaproteobacteria bacterium]|nr:IS200/IS605 family transposase [Deltaproteobacteria bacterium]